MRIVSCTVASVPQRILQYGRFPSPALRARGSTISSVRFVSLKKLSSVPKKLMMLQVLAICPISYATRSPPLSQLRNFARTQKNIALGATGKLHRNLLFGKLDGGDAATRLL
jgi:hypothetical protein